MYDTTDPRSALTQAHSPHATHFAGADYIKFYQIPPVFDDKEGRSWYARGQNFVVAYTEAKAGALLKRTAQPDMRRHSRTQSRSKRGRSLPTVIAPAATASTCHRRSPVSDASSAVRRSW